MVKVIGFMRRTTGTHNSRRDRMKGYAVATIHYHNQSFDVLLKLKTITNILNNPHLNHYVLDLTIQRRKTITILYKLETDHISGSIKHLSLKRIESTTNVIIKIPVKFIKEDKKQSRYALMVYKDSVYVECLPQDVPNFVPVDVRGEVIEGSIRLKDVKLPQGVQLSKKERNHVLLKLKETRKPSETQPQDLVDKDTQPLGKDLKKPPLPVSIVRKEQQK
jgi:large subunit ribosomal protein L25